MTTTIHNPEPCPNCGQTLDASSGVSDEQDHPKPEPEDVGICLYCSCVFQFDSNLSRKIMTEEQIEALPHETKLIVYTTQEAIRQVIAARRAERN